MNLLAYVHLRNIYRSTGAGRTARQVTEHLAQRAGINLRILADAADREKFVPLAGAPWTGFPYSTFERETSRQQAQWFLFDKPPAEAYWPAADIVYCTGESYVPSQKAKLVVTAHDAGYFDEGAHRRDRAYWKTRLKWTLLFRKLQQKADLFHTVSHFSAERLAFHFPAIASRIRPVYNGVAPFFFEGVHATGKNELARLGLANARYVLIPGGLHYRKNADLIVEAVPRLLKLFPNLIVAVVNHTDPYYAAQTRDFGDRFRLLGFVSDEVLHALYAGAAVVWYPSRYEGFGLPVVEAMASGAAVVASNSSSIPEIAGDAAVLADPLSVQAHVTAIADLLTDSAATQQLTAAGRMRAQHFTWERSAAELHGHFLTLL